MAYFSILPKGATITQSINLKVKVGASYDPQLNNETLNFDNVSGSQTITLGDGGGELKITSIFQLKKDPKDIENLKKLQTWYLGGTTVTIVYAKDETYSNLIIGGDYKITDAQITEPKKGKYEVSLTLQKQKIIPVETKTFTNWKPAKKTSTKSRKKKISTLYSSLSKCKIPLYKDKSGKNKSTKCDETFQKILRLFNFYIRYKGKTLKIDGYYGAYTKWACKNFQKKYKLKVTGRCDKATMKKIKALTSK